MNIFFLSFDIKDNVKFHNNKHTVKMILEYGQLLCGVHRVLGDESPYKLSHKNHPCSIWVRESLTNYNYLCDLGLSLSKEYTHRYGKKHKTEEVLLWCKNNKPKIKDIGFTEPPKAMPEEYKTNCVVESYRNYYMGAKREINIWSKREIPYWYN